MVQINPIFNSRVDFFIPGLSTVGGFSICSSPKKLKEKSIIELAVKYSEHPPAFWIHNEVCTSINHLGVSLILVQLNDELCIFGLDNSTTKCSDTAGRFPIMHSYRVPDHPWLKGNRNHCLVH